MLSIGTDLKQYREKLGLSQLELSEILNVSKGTINRWENNHIPSNLGIEKLKELKIIKEEDIRSVLENKRLDNSNKETTNLKREFTINNHRTELKYPNYVINGPENQRAFHDLLVDMQQHENIDLPLDKYIKRLSLVESIDNLRTSQSLLEAPRKTAKSWNSNYSTHGWHRYIGRFPPHLVRALLNNFKAGKNDLVLDPFSGSGTTLVECRLLGIPAIGIEISPLSALISKTKSQFPLNYESLLNLSVELELFYYEKWTDFLGDTPLEELSYKEIINRKGNLIKDFANYEKWFSKEALLGTSIVIEFADKLVGYERDFILIALSSKMRSIGNVDVDVVRAEYSKKPRLGVDVLKLVRTQILKMVNSIKKTVDTHDDIIEDSTDIQLINDDLLSTQIAPESISHIITSPPYGVESISYFRTHLLSFRVFEHFLNVDPYQLGENVIGSEFIAKETPEIKKFISADLSHTFEDFFDSIYSDDLPKKLKTRTLMMMNFFDDMNDVITKFKEWLKIDGKVAFVIGNKKIGDTIIPTNNIIQELFESHGFKTIDIIQHKLKTNNSNSQVPWQERIIEEEYIMIFQKGE